MAEQLGMNGVTENSLDAVADRDFVLELLADFFHPHGASFALCRGNLPVVLVGIPFMALDDRFSTGSSIMPQKKNPDLAD